MRTLTHTRTARTSLKQLAREVSLLRSGLISIIGRDDEGVYRPEFVQEVLKASEQTPQFAFTKPGDLLRELKRK